MKRVHILTLGCPKNSVDSEVLAAYLSSGGCAVVDHMDDADVAVVNTCGFIQPAVEEGIDVVLDLERLKKEGRLREIAVVGCMVNRYGEDLKREFPSVDYWADAEDWAGLAERMALRGSRSGRHRLSKTPWSRYLKVGEGCDTRCSFCAIPSIRGPLRSRPLATLVDEAATLTAQGAKELCLVGQDLTMYGSDLADRPSLSDLLDRLEARLSPDVWVRLFYLHPSRVDRAFLRRVLDSPIVVPWLDIPVQHVDDDILRRMHRPPVGDHIRSLFRTGRDIFPDFAFRTTVMVGFPGETDEAFESLLDFVEEVQFDRLGAFTFFAEEGTPAAALPDQVPQDVKDHRYAQLMELQQEISLRRQRRFVGAVLDVLVDEVDEDGVRWGRSYRDAPDIDGLVAVSHAPNVQPGDRISVTISDASEYDLFGELVTEA